MRPWVLRWRRRLRVAIEATAARAVCLGPALDLTGDMPAHRDAGARTRTQKTENGPCRFGAGCLLTRLWPYEHPNTRNIEGREHHGFHQPPHSLWLVHSGITACSADPAYQATEACSGTSLGRDGLEIRSSPRVCPRECL